LLPGYVFYCCYGLLYTVKLFAKAGNDLLKVHKNLVTLE